eukprot:scaffold500270_cov52-Prasinocladus_malaysianus.AAC.1
MADPRTPLSSAFEPDALRRFTPPPAPNGSELVHLRAENASLHAANQRLSDARDRLSTEHSSLEAEHHSLLKDMLAFAALSQPGAPSFGPTPATSLLRFVNNFVPTTTALFVVLSTLSSPYL